MEPLSIGDRVADSAGYIGTVAYIGPICLSKPSIQWIGVIWDCDGRGKNDGSLEDETGIHRYFTCRENGGSFVQASKLHRRYSIYEAFVKKYKQEGKESYRSSEQVGRFQLKQECTRTADLSNMFISDFGVCDALLLNLENLDLSWNQIVDWTVFITILDSLPHLRILLLNHNALHPDSHLPSHVSPIEILSLSYTNLHFNSILPLFPYLPSLVNLSLAYNEMGSVSCELPVSSSLRSLDLSNSSISEWSILSSLASLPSLKDLYLEGNDLGSKPIDTSFTNLRFINLMNTGIESINQLKSLLIHFPAVIDIELRENEFYSQSPNGRVTLIALFPQLKRLNGSVISKEERDEAEISELSREMTAFLDSIHLSLEAFVVQSPEVIRKQLEGWSDLKRLIDIHGYPHIQTPTSASTKICVHIQSSSGGKEMNFVQTLTIRQVLQLACKVFHKQPFHIRLFTYADNKKVYLNDGIQSLKDLDLTDGSFIGMEDCDEIVFLQ